MRYDLAAVRERAPEAQASCALRLWHRLRAARRAGLAARVEAGPGAQERSARAAGPPRSRTERDELEIAEARTSWRPWAGAENGPTTSRLRCRARRDAGDTLMGPSGVDGSPVARSGEASPRAGRSSPWRRGLFLIRIRPDGGSTRCATARRALNACRAAECGRRRASRCAPRSPG